MTADENEFYSLLAKKLQEHSFAPNFKTHSDSRKKRNRESGKRFRKRHSADPEYINSQREKKASWYRKNRTKILEYLHSPEGRAKKKVYNQKYYQRRKLDPEFVARNRANAKAWYHAHKNKTPKKGETP